MTAQARVGPISAGLARLLADPEQLGLPARILTVVTVDALPRRPNGKMTIPPSPG